MGHVFCADQLSAADFDNEYMNRVCGKVSNMMYKKKNFWGSLVGLGILVMVGIGIANSGGDGFFEEDFQIMCVDENEEKKKRKS